MYEAIAEQLKDYCSCISEKDFVDTDKLEKNVGQLVQLISTMTCWSNKPCETFLSSDREEVFDIGEFETCGCDSGIVTVDLFYPMIDVSSIKVYVLKRQGVKFTKEEVDVDDFTFNPYERLLYIDLTNVGITDVCNCDCTVFSKLIIDYVAGYETIPECLLPVFCDFFQFVIAMNKCECSCSTCEGENDVDDVIISEENSEAQITISQYIKEHIASAYALQIGVISICGFKRRWLGTVV